MLFKHKCVSFMEGIMLEGIVLVFIAKLGVLLHQHLLNKLIICQTSKDNKITCILVPTILAGETT